MHAKGPRYTVKSRRILYLIATIALLSGWRYIYSQSPSKLDLSNFAPYRSPTGELLGVEVQGIVNGFGEAGYKRGVSKAEAELYFPGEVDPSYDILKFFHDDNDVFDMLPSDYPQAKWIVYWGNGFTEQETQRVSELFTRLRKLKKLSAIKLIRCSLRSKDIFDLEINQDQDALYFGFDDCEIDGRLVQSG